MKKMQQGFTLIELMIVVAIVGILAAIALPAYQDYIARSKTTEAMADLDSWKISIAEFVSSQGTAALASALADTVGVPTTVPANAKYVQGAPIFSATVGTASIGIKLNNINSDLTGKIITLNGTVNATDATILWTCTSDATVKRLLPANCRG